jgi:pimeloyl-ACP methyl ester carboxylesterase
VPPHRLAEAAEKIQNCRLVIIPAGHRVHSRNADQFRTVVVPFLTDDRRA